MADGDFEHTGHLAHKSGEVVAVQVVPGIHAQAGIQRSLGVTAGHALNRDNLAAFVREVPGVLEVSIGHALIADALELGYAATVQAYQTCIDSGFEGRNNS